MPDRRTVQRAAWRRPRATTGGFEAYLQDRAGAGSDALMQTANRLLEAARKRPELAGLRTTFSTATPQYYAELDREKARALNVPINEVFTIMQSSFGSLYVNDFTLFGRSYRVNLQCAASSSRLAVCIKASLPAPARSCR